MFKPKKYDNLKKAESAAIMLASHNKGDGFAIIKVVSRFKVHKFTKNGMNAIRFDYQNPLQSEEYYLMPESDILNIRASAEDGDNFNNQFSALL